MSIIELKQPPLRIRGYNKTGVRSQFGALCYRVRKDQVEVLLITSRTRGRWIIPKGWPVEGATPADAAATEAFEEAGVTGRTYNICLGLYSYTKVMAEDKSDLPCVVSVFPVKVKKVLAEYPEMKQRKRKWFSVKKAAARVREPELRKILKHFDPSLLER